MASVNNIASVPDYVTLSARPETIPRRGLSDPVTIADEVLGHAPSQSSAILRTIVPQKICYLECAGVRGILLNCLHLLTLSQFLNGGDGSANANNALTDYPLE